MASCATRSASIISASEISSPSPSTIKISLAFAATINSKEAPANSLTLGFTLYSPLILATRTSEIGPLNGISETASAAAAARPTKASGKTSESAEIKLINTCTSAW